MVAYIYQKLVEEGVRAGQVPARTVSARNWFRSLAEQTAGSSPSQIVNTALASEPDKYGSSVKDITAMITSIFST